MELEKAVDLLKKIILVNNSVIKETRKNGDINAIELTNDLDTQSSAIETVLKALENSIDKEKIKNIFEVHFEQNELNFQEVNEERINPYQNKSNLKKLKKTILKIYLLK